MKILAKSKNSHKTSVLDYTSLGFKHEDETIPEDDVSLIYVVLNGVPTWLEPSKFHKFVSQWGTNLS